MAAFDSVDELYRSLIDSSQKDKNLEMEESILETLFRDQRYDLVLYALEKGFSLNTKIIEEIKVSGDINLYQYLFQNQNLELNIRLMISAVESGNLETIKWLRENGCPWDKRMCGYAALGGHLEILKWCRENGCPWPENLYHYVGMYARLTAKEGHSKVLKWLRENGCS